jgi:hypothetical protein
MPNCRIAPAQAQPKLAVVAMAATIVANRRIDPDQRVGGPAASKVPQGNGPDAVPIPISFNETEYVGP